MKKETYSTLCFENALRSLVSLAAAADTPPEIVYGILRAWVVAYENLWEESGIPPSDIAGLQQRSYSLAEHLMDELRKGKVVVGKFPDEVPDNEGESND